MPRVAPGGGVVDCACDVVGLGSGGESEAGWQGAAPGYLKAQLTQSARGVTGSFVGCFLAAARVLTGL